MNLRQAIATLPSTEVGITKMFRDQGIRGTPASATACPMARWLSLMTGQEVHVTSKEAWVTGSVSATLPPHASNFVEDFDDDVLPGREALLEPISGT